MREAAGADDERRNETTLRDAYLSMISLEHRLTTCPRSDRSAHKRVAVLHCAQRTAVA